MFRKKYLIVIELILILPLLFVACEKSSVTNPPTTANTSSFPNKVGDKWIYAVHDSINNSIDTLVIEIVGTVSINNQTLSVWLMNSNSYKDSSFVSADSESVVFYQDRNATLTDHKYELPLVVGNYWYNPGQQFDSTIVKSKEEVTVPANVFPEAFKLERKWGSFNVYGNSDTWIVNNIGIVKLYRKIYGYDNINETWELLSYNIQ
jgi:hypothetical protein